MKRTARLAKKCGIAVLVIMDLDCHGRSLIVWWVSSLVAKDQGASF